MVNRLLVAVLMGYELGGGKGDMVYLPGVALASAVGVCAARLAKSDKMKEFMQRFGK